MIIAKEITEASYPNHTYHMSDDRAWIFGYIPKGKTKVVMFSKPMQFSVKGRKFTVIKTIKENKPKDSIPANAIKVAGSKGSVYYVTKNASGYSCTCQGFMFRRKCRHIEEAK